MAAIAISGAGAWDTGVLAAASLWDIPGGIVIAAISGAGAWDTVVLADASLWDIPGGIVIAAISGAGAWDTGVLATASVAGAPSGSSAATSYRFTFEQNFARTGRTHTRDAPLRTTS